MSLQEGAAAILISNQKSLSPDVAKETVLKVFKDSYPYWSFSDWSIDLPMTQAKTLIRIYAEHSGVSVKELIDELPTLVRDLRN